MVQVFDQKTWQMTNAAEADIREDGTFEVTGAMDSTCYAMLVIDNPDKGIPFFLENADYTFTVDVKTPSAAIESDGAAQQLANQYWAEDSSNLFRITNLAAVRWRVLSIPEESRDAQAEAVNRQYEEAQSRHLAVLKKYLQTEGQDYVAACLLCGGLQGMDGSGWMSQMNFVATHLTSGALDNMSLNDLRECHSLLSEKGKALSWGKKVETCLALRERTDVGQAAPDFTVQTPDGGKLTLYDVKGKVKLLDFWASWCHPCRELNPELIALYEKYHDKGLEIVGISLDNDKDAWVKAIRDDKLPWLQGSDLGDGFRSPTAQLYGVFSVPASYLLDENNRIVAKYLRGEALERKVAEMLGE